MVAALPASSCSRRSRRIQPNASLNASTRLALIGKDDFALPVHICPLSHVVAFGRQATVLPGPDAVWVH
jgi:hypothetical protein